MSGFLVLLLVMPRPLDRQSARSRPRHPSRSHRDPRRTREEHSHEIAQDYVEIIADLIAATGEARVIDGTAARCHPRDGHAHDSAASARWARHQSSLSLDFSYRPRPETFRR